MCSTPIGEGSLFNSTSSHGTSLEPPMPPVSRVMLGYYWTKELVLATTTPQTSIFHRDWCFRSRSLILCAGSFYAPTMITKNTSFYTYRSFINPVDWVNSTEINDTVQPTAKYCIVVNSTKSLNCAQALFSRIYSYSNKLKSNMLLSTIWLIKPECIAELFMRLHTVGFINDDLHTQQIKMWLSPSLNKHLCLHLRYQALCFIIISIFPSPTQYKMGIGWPLDCETP